MKSTKNFSRRQIGALAAGLFAAPALLPRTARAAAWPERPVRIIVPFGAGGAIDTLIRACGQRFAEFANGQPLVVENRSGAGGMVGGAYAAAQPPDGYTLFGADIGANVLGRELNPKISYDPMTSFTPITQLVNLDAAIVVNPNLPARSLKEFIEAAKQKPESFVYSSAGVGNGSHLFMALLAREAGIKMIHVPYRSGAETVTAVMRGDAQLCFPTVSSALQMIRGGQVKAMALGSIPSPLLPGVPLVKETLPNFDVAIWYGVAAPAGMDLALADRISGVFQKIAALPELKKMVEEVQGGRIVASSRVEFGNFLSREYERWTPVIREGGIRME